VVFKKSIPINERWRILAAMGLACKTEMEQGICGIFRALSN
jgi:hypothetical protein